MASSRSLGEVVSDGPSSPSATHGPAWRATFSVEGMTCAVCLNTITDALHRASWVDKAVVSLGSNSAMVELQDKEKVAEAVQIIENLGYEATLDNIVSTIEDAEKVKTRSRTVDILINGFYCPLCPARAVSTLAGLGHELHVIDEPTLRNPILRLSYLPDSPIFTIRHILEAIKASDPAMTATLYHPPSLEERSKFIQRRHQKHLFYRVVLAAVMAIPTFIIGIVYMSLVPQTNSTRQFLMAPWTSGIDRAQIALLVLATPVYIFAADVFHVRACKEIWSLWRRGSRTPVYERFYRFGSMNTLISLGTSIAYLSSVGQLIAAGAAGYQVKDSDFYFDSVVFLTLFILIGRLIESYSRSKASDAVEKLTKLRPTTATLVENFGSDSAKDTVIQADLLEFGEAVRVVHGASPPADGAIVQGTTSFDESSLTGESRPVKKTEGDRVFAGTLNKGAPVVIRIADMPGRSMLDQIVQAVREGQTKRAPMEQVADRLTAYFVPFITLIAVVTWIVWLSLGLSGRLPGEYVTGDDGPSTVPSGSWVAFALEFAIAVFVVACPCGLALAAPTAVFVGGGLAARHGILAKGGGEAFEKASGVDCVVFDKTGTLTAGGDPSVTDHVDLITPGADGDAAEYENARRLWTVLKVVEESSSHPIARAVVALAASKVAVTDVSEGEKPASADDITSLEEIPGKGMRASYRHDAHKSFDVILGSESLMQDFSVKITNECLTALQKWRDEGKSVALAATRRRLTDGDSGVRPSDPEQSFTLAAMMAISDPIRPETPGIISSLRASGMRVWMLTGDNPATAAAVARMVGIPQDHVIAGVLPTQKAAQIKYLQSTQKKPLRRHRLLARHRLSASTSSGVVVATVEADDVSELESTSRRATVAFVGDGINDAPALAAADVSIALGSGTDVAVAAADFVLLSRGLRALPALLALSRAVARRVRLNMGWALVYNLVAVPIAAGALYAVVSGKNGSQDGGGGGGEQHVRLDPVWASLAMALSSISVVLSSLALRTRLPLLGFRAEEREA